MCFTLPSSCSVASLPFFPLLSALRTPGFLPLSLAPPSSTPKDGHVEHCCISHTSASGSNRFFASSSSACHFIAMVSFPRIVTPQANQIDMLIRILLARSILDLAEDIPESLSTSSCDLLFSGIPQPTGGLHLSAVLDAMGGRLQSWPTSPLVVLAQPRCLGSKPVSDYLLGHCRPCFHLVPLSYLRLGPVPSWTTSRVVFLNMQPSWFLIRLGLAESSPKLWPAWAPCKRSGFCFNGYPHGLLVQLSKLRGNGPLRRISYSIFSVSKALAHSWRRHIGNFNRL